MHPCGRTVWYSTHAIHFAVLRQRPHREQKPTAGRAKSTHDQPVDPRYLRNLPLPLVSCVLSCDQCIHSVFSAPGKDGNTFHRCR